MYLARLNIVCYFFLRFYVLGYNYKGHNFLRAGAFAPVAPPSATRLISGGGHWELQLLYCL